MKSQRTRHRTPDSRNGATIVETAVVFPVFLTFLFAIIEFGHAFMCTATLTAAAKDAARYGSVDGITSNDVIQRAFNRVSGAFKNPHPTVMVKNASIFENANVDPKTIDITALPDVELSTSESRQLFIVRVSVPYDRVAVLPPLWAKGIVLHAESVMRHE